MLKVGVFGSCRVHAPLQMAGKANRIIYAFDNVFGYMHTTKEVIQAVSALRCEKEIPQEIYNLISPHLAPLGTGDLFAKHYADADLFVVEISSVRIVEYIGIVLQINRLREKFGKGEDVEQAIKAFTRSAGAWRGIADAYLEKNTVDPVFADVLREASMREQNLDELEDDMALIVEKLGKPVLFVSFWSHDFEGRPIKPRMDIKEAANRTAERPTVDHFDPTALIQDAGIRRVLIDMGHYKPQFEPIVSNYLVAAISKLAWKACPTWRGEEAVSV